MSLKRSIFNNKHIPKKIRIFPGNVINFIKTLTETFYLIFSNTFN